MPCVPYGAGNVNSPRDGRNAAICAAVSSGRVVVLLADSMKPPDTVWARTRILDEKTAEMIPKHTHAERTRRNFVTFISSLALPVSEGEKRRP
jgi:hypothetical protein